MAPTMATMSVRTTNPRASAVRPVLVASRVQSVPRPQKVEFTAGEVAQKVTAAVLAGMLVATPVFALDKSPICASNATAKICLKGSGKKQ